MSAALGDGGPGERCNYEWAAEGSRKQDPGQVHDVGLHGASARLVGCVQGPDTLGTGGVDLERDTSRPSSSSAAISASPGTTVLLGLGLR